MFLLGRHRESFLLFEEICKDGVKRQLQADKKANDGHTCDLHLSGASVLLAAGRDGLRLDGAAVVVDLRHLDLLHGVVVAELGQLALEVAVAFVGDALNMVDSIYFRHFVAGHGLPVEIFADFRRSPQLEIKFPTRRGF